LITSIPSIRRSLRSGPVLKVAAGIAISAIFLYATFAAVPLDEVAAALSRASPLWVVAAVGFIGCSYTARSLRWRLMLASLGMKVRLRDAAVAQVGCVALNNVLPFRAGDVIRVVAFQRLTGVPPSAQLGTLALERLLDMLVLVTLLFAALSFWQITVLPEPLLRGLRIAAVAVIVGAALFCLAPGVIRLLVRWLEARMPQLRPKAEGLLRLSEAISGLIRAATLPPLIGISVVAWLAEGSAFFAAGQALGLALSPQTALLALCIGTLSTLIPSSPGYVGTFHYFTALVVVAFGTPRAEGTAYAILIHALLWLTTTAAGFLLLWLSGFGPRRQLLEGNGPVADVGKRGS